MVKNNFTKSRDYLPVIFYWSLDLSSARAKTKEEGSWRTQKSDRITVQDLNREHSEFETVVNDLYEKIRSQSNVKALLIAVQNRLEWQKADGPAKEHKNQACFSKYPLPVFERIP